MIKRRQNQKGLASIVVVSVLIVLLTLISLGFARIMSRTVTNSTNRQLSNTATYTAQSGVNDLVDYIKKFATDPANAANPWVRSDRCLDLIGTGASKGPFYNDANISADNNAVLSCILLDPAPYELNYTVPELKSQVIKLTTSAFSGSLQSMMVSWQATNTLNTNTKLSCCSLDDTIVWNNNGYVPMMRMTIYPVPVNTASATMDNLQRWSKTTFLYPLRQSGTNVDKVDFANSSQLSDGQIKGVRCNGASTDPTTTAPFVGTPDYQCNLIVNNLVGSVPAPEQINYLYVRLTPVYGQADIKVKTNDIWNQRLRFIGVQALADITARVSNVSKRLQARIDISKILGSSSGNEAALDNNLPEDSLRSASALCKRVILHNSYFNYVTVDDSNNVCGTNTTIITPPPTLAFSIFGNDGPDNGVRVCSQPWNAADQSAWGCANDDNPRPQSPPRKGTVYINSYFQLFWRTTDAVSCQAGGGWSGQKLDPPTVWSGTTANGGQNIGPISNVTDYNLTCVGPGSPTPLVKTVTAWPPPRVSMSGPGSVNAGDSYTISWGSANVKPDAFGPCNLSGEWNETGVPSSGSRTFTWPWNDNSSVRRYRTTCYDPIGRSATTEWVVSVSGGGCPSCTTVLPPRCSADWNISDNGNGTGTLTWNGACPIVSPLSGYYQFYNCNAELAAWTAGCSWVGNARVATVGPGTYCGNYRAGADPWGWLADSGYKCFIVQWPPVVIDYFIVDGPHYQFWQCWSPGNFYHLSWNCANSSRTITIGGNTYGRDYAPGTCADGSHSVTICGAWWGAHQDGGLVICNLDSNGLLLNTSGPSNPTSGGRGIAGWIGLDPLANLHLRCFGYGGRTADAYWGPY